MDVYAPGTLSRFSALTTIEESDVVPDARTMLINIRVQNTKMLDTLRNAYNMAEEEKQVGVANYLQDRIQAHEKHGWMLRAITK